MLLSKAELRSLPREASTDKRRPSTRMHKSNVAVSGLRQKDPGCTVPRHHIISVTTLDVRLRLGGSQGWGGDNGPAGCYASGNRSKQYCAARMVLLPHAQCDGLRERSPWSVGRHKTSLMMEHLPGSIIPMSRWGSGGYDLILAPPPGRAGTPAQFRPDSSRVGRQP